MVVKQFYEKCLSQASYYIEHKGIAAVIDPLRDTSQYLNEAQENGAKILYIFETHFHADFVSGHLELADTTGARIIFGPDAETRFASYNASDEECFDLNGLKIKLLHTPGHTLESSCYLLTDEAGKDHALFTGDTLFLGDVGRPDLAQSSKMNLRQQELAGMLYDSLRTKILPLSDELIIYPGHGAGSACGKNLSEERYDSLGNQRMTNYALDPSLNKDEFVSLLCNGLLTPPPYFAMNVNLNKRGYGSLSSAYERGENPLSVSQFKHRMSRADTLVLDVRSSENFARKHIQGSLNIGLNGSFAPWVGSLIPVDQKEIILVCDPGREKETITRLSRVGYDQCSGYLAGGIEEWNRAGELTDQVQNIEVKHFKLNPSPNYRNFIDVRNQREAEQDSIEGSINIPLEKNFRIPEFFDSSKEYLVYCAGGYRSMIFISMMRLKGYKNLVNVSGGLSAIRSLQTKSGF